MIKASLKQLRELAAGPTADQGQSQHSNPRCPWFLSSLPWLCLLLLGPCQGPCPIHLRSSSASRNPATHTAGVHSRRPLPPRPTLLPIAPAVSGLGEGQSPERGRLGKPRTLQARCLVKNLFAFLGVQHSRPPAGGAAAPSRHGLCPRVDLCAQALRAPSRLCSHVGEKVPKGQSSTQNE